MPRKAHVKRIFRLKDDDQPDKENFVDMLRLDEFTIRFQSTPDGRQGQNIKHKFKWNDDQNNPDSSVDDSAADSQHENANPSRKTRILKIKNPDSSDDTAVKLWILDRAKIIMPQGAITGVQGQAVNFVFRDVNSYALNNTIPPYEDTSIAKRGVSVIKVVGNSLNGFDMTFADGSSKIIDWDVYKQFLMDGVKSDASHLNVEVVDDFKVIFGPDNQSGAQGQLIKYVLTGNQELEPGNDHSLGLFDPGDPDSASVLRTDPLQTIVNFQFRPPPHNPPIALWKRSGTVYGQAWQLVFQSDSGSLNPPYVAARKGLVDDGFLSQNFAIEYIATGLVDPHRSFDGHTSDLFVDFGSAAAASSLTPEDVPGLGFTDSSFTAAENRAFITGSFNLFIETWYKLHP